jgi:hypothetical protein
MTLSSWDGSYAYEPDWQRHLNHFEDIGVNYIEVLTFAHQPRVNSPKIRLSAAEKWPRRFIDEARRRGFKILLKPHVWSREFYDGSNRWRGSINMQSDEEWTDWFRQYRIFITREARLAEAAGVEMLSIGLEYVEASKRTADWRRLIAEIRTLYSGALTYAADGNHELGHIEFWDDLDIIGVDAYFNVGNPILTGGPELALYWAIHIARLQALAKRYDRPIVFTEAGYPSVAGATSRAWKWPSGKESVDLELQADAYEALLTALTPQPWFAGVFWWKWYERPERGTPHSHDYSPRGKPAQAVVRRWYRHRRGSDR